MLQPKNYPQLVGKALFLEGEPFITMVDDDDPWVEGLFLVVVMSALIAIAQFVGGLLLTLSLPPSNALLEAVIQGWRLIAGELGFSNSGVVDAVIRQQWDLLAAAVGFGGGMSRLLIILFVPAAMVVQWFLYGLLGHGVARLLGGHATLNQTLGATALLVAPNVLLLLTIVPFVNVSALLILVWSLLIVYRALQIAHDLSWQRAAGAALLTPILVLVATATMVSAMVVFLAWIGG